MFTGIIEEVGKIRELQQNCIVVDCTETVKGTKCGDSIAVNGVCLTVKTVSKEGFIADISSETRKVSALKNLKNGSFVNLERAMPAEGRFGGHIVTGHVDGTGQVVKIKREENFYTFSIKPEKEQLKYIVRKGSVTINGISLTVADISENTINIAIIPHTFENTILKYTNEFDIVNIETDIFAKYIVLNSIYVIVPNAFLL